MPTFSKKQPSSLGCYFSEKEPFFRTCHFPLFPAEPLYQLIQININPHWYSQLVFPIGLLVFPIGIPCIGIPNCILLVFPIGISYWYSYWFCFYSMTLETSWQESLGYIDVLLNCRIILLQLDQITGQPQGIITLYRILFNTLLHKYPIFSNK